MSNANQPSLLGVDWSKIPAPADLGGAVSAFSMDLERAVFLIGDRLVREERGFELRRRDLVALVLDHLLGAVVDRDVPLVVDGDALSALGERAADILRARSAAAVLTPHDGEYERLTGRRISSRIEEVLA